MTSAAPAKPSTEESVNVSAPVFTVSGVLTRLRGTLTTWVGTLTTLAAAVFTGFGLQKYVEVSPTAPAGLVVYAMLSMVLVVLGVLAVLGVAGWVSSLNATPQDGAWTDGTEDPVRFFPANTASGLLEEYRREVRRFVAARSRDDVAAMAEANAWRELHERRLWEWLEAYRARKISQAFPRVSVFMGAGAVVFALGAIGFADALRRMGTPTPETKTVIMAGPRSGALRFVSTSTGTLAGCVTGTPGLLEGEVMKVVAPTARQKNAGVAYITSFVPASASSAIGTTCPVHVYEVPSTVARVLIPPDMEEAPVETAKGK